jgi:hypothetical protein
VRAGGDPESFELWMRIDGGSAKELKKKPSLTVTTSVSLGERGFCSQSPLKVVL